MTRHGFVAVAIFGAIALLMVRLPPMVAQQDSIFNTYRALVEVNALAKQRYAVPIPKQRLVDGAIRGMLQQLDPYSGYIPPEYLDAFLRRSSGEFIGVGIEIGERHGDVTVIAPIAQGPAAHAGVLAGDVILEIDGTPTSELSVFDVNEKLAGKPGSRVTLLLATAGADEPRTVTITRGEVSLTTVRGYRRLDDGQWDFVLDPDNGIGYIRVSEFRETTRRDLDAALRALHPQNLHGLVLDLRFNPGGLMDQAVAMVDRFVDSGLIVQALTRRGVEQSYLASRDHTLTEPVLAVLVNGGSASSAEIVAGALQDHERATIVGSRSFGKGSMQHLIELESIHAAIKLTVGFYRLPNGRIVHRFKGEDQHTWGIDPDVRVEIGDREARRIQETRLSLDVPHARHPDDPQTVVIDTQLKAAWDDVVRRLKENSRVADGG